MRFEIERLETLHRRLMHPDGLDLCVVQGLDLRGETALLQVSARESLFLGCRLDDAAREHLEADGALIFPRLPAIPYHPYRGTLYTPEELMAGYRHGEPASLADTFDQRVYRHFDQMRARRPTPITETLAQRLHDHAIDDALDELLRGPMARGGVVAIMGGHGMARDEPGYLQVARIAARLTRDHGMLMASGGGPGAMEATQLGAWMSGHGDEALTTAVGMLTPAPTFEHPRWLDTAFDVRQRFPCTAASVSVPTWFYGHEPPNVFATHIAKYFANSIREDGLLAIATRGVVFAPGSAGTIQEIFQDACQNHYATHGLVSPMVFMDRGYWTETKPVFPLLAGLAAGRPYGRLLSIGDSADEVVGALLANAPFEPAADH